MVESQFRRGNVLFPIKFLPIDSSTFCFALFHLLCKLLVEKLPRVHFHWFKSTCFFFGYFLVQIKAHLGDYDAIHVRRGDKIKTRKDRFGVARSLHPHLDRDTRPEFILHRIEKWVPPGRTLFIASNEKKPEFFSLLSAR